MGDFFFIFDHLRAEPFFADNMDSFNLSATDRAKALSLKIDDDFRYATDLEKLAKTTTNVGFQYLMLSKQETVLSVAANDNLNPKVIKVFLEATQLITPMASLDHGHRLDVFSIYRVLVQNKTVVNDMNLFMQIFTTFENFENNMSSKNREGSYVQLLHSALIIHSKKSTNYGASMSVGTLLFISSLLNKLHRSTTLTMTKSLRDSIIETREDEVRAWIEENMPDYVDFPISWIYEVFDLYAYAQLANFQAEGDSTFSKEVSS